MMKLLEDLKEAVQNQKLEKLRKLPGLDKNSFPDLSYAGWQYLFESLLRTTVDNENKDMLEALREKANIRENQKFNFYILMLAISKGRKTFVKKIIEEGTINPNDYASKKNYITPMMLAIKKEQLDIIKYFIEKYHEDPEKIIENPKLEKEDENAQEKKGEKERVFVHRMLEYYRARANPIYICFKRLYGSTGQNNPLSEALDLHNKIQKQASIDFEFKEEYKKLSDQLEDFAEHLMDNCRNQEEKTTLTDVYQDVKDKGLEHVLIKMKKDENDKVLHELTFLNWAIKENCEKLIAHPFNQLRLTFAEFDNGENMGSTWRKHKYMANFTFALEHFLLLTLFWIVIPIRSIVPQGKLPEKLKNFEKYVDRLKTPRSKFLSNMWSVLVFNSLLIASSFQDKHDEPANPSIAEWLILSWLFGIIVQVLNELWYQGYQRYLAQWWNVVRVLMLIFFVLSYSLKLSLFITWAVTDSSTDFILSAWYKVFLIANSFFVIGMVLSFTHLSVFLQLSHVVGPLQLALYHLIFDVMDFIAFFAFFFFAFWISFRKLYWYYTGTQTHILKTQGMSINGTETVETDHRYSRIEPGMYWLFLSLYGHTDPQSFTARNEVTSDTGHFLFSVFQILAVTVSMNILIAMMTRSFDEIMRDAKKKWKVSRTRLLMFWMGLEDRCVLPPPLNVIKFFLDNMFVKPCKKAIYWYKKSTGNSESCQLPKTESKTESDGAPMQLDPEREGVLFIIVQRYIVTYCKEKGLELKDISPNDDRISHWLKLYCSEMPINEREDEKCRSSGVDTTGHLHIDME